MRRRTVYLMLAASGLGAMGYGTMFTVVDDFRDKFGIPESHLGLILGIGFIAGFVSQIFLAPLADKGHAKTMILVGVAVQLVGNLMMGFGQSFWILFLARFIMGVGGGMITPAARRVIIVSDPRNMGTNLGLFVSFDVGGFAIGPVVSALTVDTLGLPVPFVSAAVLMAIVGVGLAVSHIDEAAAEDAPSQRLAFDLLRIAPCAGAVVIGLSLYLMIGTFDTLWSVMMADIEAETWIANLGITLFALPMLFLGPIGGRLTQRIGPFVAAICGLTTASLFMSLYGILDSPNAMLGVGVMHGIVDGLTITAGSAAVAMTVPRERLAAAQGLYGGMQTVMGGLASVVAGWSYGAVGRTGSFVGTTVGMVALIAMGSFLARAHLRDTPTG
ncbi:MAG: MFS transporter [Actinomycetota bacterium]